MLAGSSPGILARWNATVQAARPGDTIHLVPDGGVLQLNGWPLGLHEVPITLSGAPPNGDNQAVTGNGGAGAPRGSATIKCQVDRLGINVR